MKVTKTSFPRRTENITGVRSIEGRDGRKEIRPATDVAKKKLGHNGEERRLTHRDTRRKPTDGDDSPRPTHMRRPFSRCELIYERRECVEQEILDHHLKNKDLGCEWAEGVPES